MHYLYGHFVLAESYPKWLCHLHYFWHYITSGRPRLFQRYQLNYFTSTVDTVWGIAQKVSQMLTVWNIFCQFQFSNIRCWCRTWRNIWNQSFQRITPLLWVIGNAAVLLLYLYLLNQNWPSIFRLWRRLSLASSHIW